ncbi:OmpH family outer membrane protein [Flavobacterium suncheonense]|uniref:Membrane protein n=1 Tax=Flavobacterium suncheonense GH29-5 = DSM 17707 TaxID=1121899 RepID=A0A0A2M908_9FLAO|nr:OmpH family outer membrane protein [Flavobacterium suncheonense]KGO89142.1 membrane protein [Flavobacterium suncheonense GH29-5 = DSM 17707]
MKKLILLSVAALAIISCNKETPTAEKIKTAYIDTSKLLEENNEAKDIEEKYKVKSEEMGRELRAEASKFQSEAASFQQNAMAKGQAWAQAKGAELQKREQELGIKQQAMMQTLQQESGKEMDSLVKRIKDYIKDYGKKNGYDYIYGTGDAATVLYAKDAYDITAAISKELNDKYKGSEKKEEPKAEEKK